MNNVVPEGSETEIEKKWDVLLEETRKSTTSSKRSTETLRIRWTTYLKRGTFESGVDIDNGGVWQHVNRGNHGLLACDGDRVLPFSCGKTFTSCN